MGVSGCGKSSVGERLASYLDCPFVEGDNLHRAATTNPRHAQMRSASKDAPDMVESARDGGARRAQGPVPLRPPATRGSHFLGQSGQSQRRAVAEARAASCSSRKPAARSGALLRRFHRHRRAGGGAHH
ncbi:shikimate kinase [Sinorhizobium sp. 7-81]|nr:shikimate kinase [Sinorhizobium sp. 8-89]MDK1492045.1 shikimate kinase [Sinorhizobium sp. 8-89]